DPLLMLVCTVKKAEGSLILAAVEEGTGSRLHYACPDCGAFQPMEWTSVRYTRADQACVGGSARYVCVGCGVAHGEDGWRLMLSRWLVVHRGQSIDGTGERALVCGPIPDTPRFGLRWTRLESPRKSLHTLCAAHARATWYLADRFEHGPMRSFVQDYLTASYDGDASDGRTDIVEGTLIERAGLSTYRRGEVPEGCTLATIGVDVQLRRHYWLAVAFDADDAWHVVDWGRDAVAGDMEQPSLEQRHAGLDRIDSLARTGWKCGTAVLMPFVACDTGFRPEELRPWIAQRRTRWIAAKGAGDELVSRMVKAPLGSRSDARGDFEEGCYDVRRQDESPDRCQIFVAADDMLDRIASDWQSGRGHLPSDVDRELLRHLTGMKPGTKRRWEPRGDRHDFLDCLVYALAVARWRRASAGPPRRYGVLKPIGN
uniref:terminase gpA endonuclease subunit n=1 Tax=Methylibium sp. TaxID=2067992 RepID=UPI0017CAFAED